MRETSGSSHIHDQPGRRIRIRRATFRDLEAVTEMSLALAATNQAVHSNPDEVVLGVRAMFERSEDQGTYFVALLDGRVVGQVRLRREWNDHRNGFTGWIGRLYVRPEVRRCGVALKLLEHVVATAEDVLEFRCNVYLGNPSAQVFERLGWRFLARNGILLVDRTHPPCPQSESDTSLLVPPASIQQAEVPQ